jgi:hypothetical protein
MNVFGKRFGEVSRHPLVVGAGLALLSGVVASLLIPALTRVWQDRPKELALKRSLVEQISKSATDAVDEAKFYLFAKRGGGVERANSVEIRMARRWQLESSIVTAQLTTYFRRSTVLREWKTYIEAVHAYEFASAFYGLRASDAGTDFLRDYFADRRFPHDPTTHRVWRRFVSDPTSFAALSSTLPILLLAERDELASQVVETPASGFSHGFWIFK